MLERPDVVIIGAGIIGCSVALELSQLGYRTLNVDKLRGPGYGSTSDSCAIVRAHYSTMDGVTMAYESFHYWHDWPQHLGVDDERGHARLVNSGTLVLKAQGLKWRKVLDLYDQIGVPYEEWTPDQILDRFPYLSLDSYWPPSRPENPSFWEPPRGRLDGGVYTPGSGYVNDPLLATHNVYVAAQAAGAQFAFDTEVKEILRKGGKVAGVKTATETIEAPIVVNVAGPHSAAINELAGVTDDMNITTRPLRHEVHLVPAPPGVEFDININDGDNVIYLRPEVGNQILVGSDDPECDPKEWIDDPDDWERHVTVPQWRAQVYRLARRIPSVEIPAQPKGIVGLYDVSDDWIPIYDRSSLPGFYMACGTSGNQFKNASVAGRLMAEIIDACEKGRDHDSDPVTINGKYTGLTIDAGFYSRLREINKESSFSVQG